MQINTYEITQMLEHIKSEHLEQYKTTLTGRIKTVFNRCFEFLKRL